MALATGLLYNPKTSHYSDLWGHPGSDEVVGQWTCGPQIPGHCRTHTPVPVCVTPSRAARSAQDQPSKRLWGGHESWAGRGLPTKAEDEGAG